MNCVPPPVWEPSAGSELGGLPSVQFTNNSGFRGEMVAHLDPDQSA